MGLKGLLSQGQQPRQPGPPNPTITYPQINPISSGMGGPMSPGTPATTTPGLNQQYYTPSTPTSPGIPHANDQTNGQHPHPPPLSVLHIPNNSSTRGQNPDIVVDPATYSVQAPQYSIQISAPPTGTRGHGDGNWDPNYFHSPHTPTSSGPPATCWLNECNEPVFVDSVTNLPSEYCSQSHRE